MTPDRRKLYARLTLLAFVALSGLWMARLDYSRKISTSVLDLIPAAEQSPELGLVRGFANNVQARVMLFALHDAQHPDVAPTEAARRFAAELSHSPLFAEAVLSGDADAQNHLGREIFDHRFELLLPSWLGERQREYAAQGGKPEGFSAWLAERAAKDLETFLARPEGTALQQLVPVDPLLLVPGLVTKAQTLNPAGAASKGHALVWARIRPSPLEEAGQQPVFDAIDAAFAHAVAAQPGLQLKWTGINRFAAASRAQIESEMRLLNIFSILAVLTVSCIFVRRVHRVLHLVPVILLSILGAWTISTLVFDRLHILVFVIGSLLSGVAIDYGFYIYMQPPRQPGEPYPEKLRRLLKPLLASCLTTVIGFSLLIFSDLPLIRQIGLFVAAGLLCALGAAMVYFAQFDLVTLEGRAFGHSSPSAKRGSRRLPQILLGVAVLVVLVGPWRLKWRDDIRQLDLPSQGLRENEAEVRALFGESAGGETYLTYGNDAGDARRNLDRFLAFEAKAAPGVQPASLGLLLPTPDDWHALPARLNELGSFPNDFRAALEHHGFDADSFQPFFRAWGEFRSKPPQGDYDKVVSRLESVLTGPLALLSNFRHPPAWFLTLVDRPLPPRIPAEFHTIAVTQLESLNGLFTRYRWSALRLSLIGLALVIASVFAIYPWRRGLRIALIPAGSCFFVFGVLGLLGQTLNLFNLLGAFLGVCLSHNYAIFSAENTGDAAVPPVSIRLSALSAASSFGVLAFSRIPVIHALGMTVALIVLTALAAVELEMWARRHAA